MTAYGGDKNILRLDCGNGHTTVILLKITELYTLNECIEWYVNYSSTAVKQYVRK